MKIGYVGLGNMGGALAARLNLSHEISVFDRDEAAVARLVARGAHGCATLAEVGASCDVVFLCLPTSEHVRCVLFGGEGLRDELRSGAVVVDQSTGDPQATRAMAAQLADRGIDLIDAPVSGGVPGAENGTIAIMVGATSAQFADIGPVLSEISTNLYHAGELGAGHTIKLVNNLLSCTQRLLTLEGMALATKNGVEAGRALEILLAGGGRNAYLENIVGADVITGEFSAAFTLGLAHKDVRLACQLGIDSNVPMFFGNLTREYYQMCVNERGPEAQVDTAALVMDRLSGTSVVPTESRER